MASKPNAVGKKVTIYIVGVIIVLSLIGVYLAKPYFTTDNSDRAAQQQKNVSLGDDKSLSKFISRLAGGKDIYKIAPRTDEKPFGVRLYGTDSLKSEDIDSMSRQILSAVKDCEWVEINSSQFHSKMTRDGKQEFGIID